ncbi:Wzz/FepE/Etk N-terminal domain-containing protein [Paludibacterium yongneupense]|uniref:Wzz/FepE/Etk N-terminal domain-containing protein n=1 Tax=Paludibacterium yongneupense TaxID=400061 RepID=UPI00048D14ED|nr:Wzz/FepE/Etk N-terminal domain-containing protein [Paludibacterium yongneupense]
MTDQKTYIPTQFESEDPILLLDLILAIARHKRLIIALPLLCLALSLAYTMTVAKHYEASSILLSPPTSDTDRSRLLPFTQSVERVTASLPGCAGNRCHFEIFPDPKNGQTVILFRAGSPELALQGANASARAILADSLSQGTTPSAVQQKLMATLAERTHKQIAALAQTLPRKLTLNAAIMQWPQAWRLAEIRADLSLIMFYKTLGLTDASNYSTSLDKFITQQSLYPDRDSIPGPVQEWLELNAQEKKMQAIRANLQDIAKTELVVIPGILPTAPAPQPHRMNPAMATLGGLVLAIVLAILQEGWKRMMLSEQNRSKIDQIKTALRS